MKVFLLLAVTMIISGCSELQIIGSAALGELRADAVNVEWQMYREVERKKPAKEPPVMMAQVVAQKHPTGNYQKGLWEGGRR